MKFLSSIILLLLSSIILKAQSHEGTDTSLTVNGVCGMCQRVIEKAADLPGVNKASWNKETKVLSLNYNSEQVKFEDIYKAVAASGYDTEYITAPDSAYQALHSCCLYREPEVVNQH